MTSAELTFTTSSPTDSCAFDARGVADQPALRGWDAPEVDTVLNDRGERLRVLNIHNNHAGPGGFEVFYEGTTEILRHNGHDVFTFERDNSTIQTLGQKVRAFGSAIHSPTTRDQVKTLIERERIDLVHLNNVWPLVSPSVITSCRQAYGGRGVPVVMSMQDYKLTCPAGQHLRNGQVCEKCLGGRELWCAFHGCRHNHVWSAAYTVRNIVNRKRRIFSDGITLYLPCSNFVSEHLAKAGYDADRMHVLPDFTDLPEDLTFNCDDKPRKEYIAYVGRISPEKGLDVLIEASRLTGLPVKIAGDPAKMPELKKIAPPQVEFVGKLSRDALPGFYRNARFSVVPSTWYECFGIVAAEAQGYGTPVIASRIGGLPEVVQDGVTGLHVNPNDPADLARAMRRLWDDPAAVSGMCRASRRRAKEQFAPDVFYRRIAAAYARAVEQHREDTAGGDLRRNISLPQREVVHA